MTTRPLTIGMIGGGTVGGGVYEILTSRLSKDCVVSKLCVRDLSKPRSFHLDESTTKLTNDVNSILDDGEIDVVVECMGGTTLAKQCVLQALQKNKSVVTANKALVAEHLEELHAAAKQSKGFLCYEAAVCGGIPIINALQTCYTGDVIHQVMGICNGTTNYMLGKMQDDQEYAQVLEEAQKLGYAEADPTADVEGHDVRSKICILAKLAFGITVNPLQVPTQGITNVTSVDFEYSKLMGCTIKLVGTAARLCKYGEHDGALSVYVAPTVVSNTHLLASARGSGNAVAVTSANMDISSYTGPGAGRFPTANSIVADVMRIRNGIACKDPFPISSQDMDVDFDYTSAFYVRIPFMDSLGIIRKIGELAEMHGVSIHSILQNPIKDRLEADFVITTEVCKVSHVRALCEDISRQDFSRSPPLCMPLLMELH